VHGHASHECFTCTRTCTRIHATIRHIQVERPVITEPQRGAGADVNIWSGRRAGERAPKRGERARSQYRCRPALDTGRTRGSQGRVGTFCSYFARGLCAEGPACRYLHRLPTAADAAAHVRDNSQDIFGRERLPDRLDNRCGAGSYVSVAASMR
jgi:hypothetical protein